MSDIAPRTEVEWLEWTAYYIAASSGAGEVTTEHLWLAILANVNSPWARLIDDYGGGTYQEWKRRWDRAMRRSNRSLPEFATQPPNHTVRRPTGLSGFRRMMLEVVFWAIRVFLWLRGHRPRPVRSLNWNPQAQQVRDSVHRWAGQSATVGHYLVMLASVPGTHQYMVWRHGPSIAAAARRLLGQQRAGDDLQLALAWPAWRARQLKRRAREDARQPRASLVAKAKAAGVSTLEWATTLLRVAVIGLATLLLYLFLLPAVLILTSARSLVSLAVGLPWKLRSGLSYPGGELEVAWPNSRVRRGATALLVFPRAAVFVLGVLGLVPLLVRLNGIGHPVISTVVERPDLLRSLTGPILLAGDLLDTNGVLPGLTVINAVGCLFLSLPTHRELEQLRLVRWSRQTYSPETAQSSILATVTVTARIADGIEDMIGWTASPVYVTVHLVPVVMGFLLATVLSLLIS